MEKKLEYRFDLVTGSNANSVIIESRLSWFVCAPVSLFLLKLVEDMSKFTVRKRKSNPPQHAIILELPDFHFLFMSLLKYKNI